MEGRWFFDEWDEALAAHRPGPTNNFFYSGSGPPTGPDRWVAIGNCRSVYIQTFFVGNFAKWWL